jgi:putative toxin-antitoxin system antitoxin component (TIGR02293 family)
LGIDLTNPINVIDRINAGFAFETLDTFEKSTDLPLVKIAALIGIPLRTLSRRRKAGRLYPDESDRLVRVARVVDKAVQLFEGDRAAAMQWLQKPQPALDGREPLDFASTDAAAREVEDLIGRLEHGVFT